VFAPLNVNTPATPFFTSDPPTPLNTPLYTVVVPPPTVSTFPCKFTPPFPAKLPIVSLPPNFITPGDVTVTALPSGIAEPPFNVNVPPLTVTAPLNVFTPPNVNSPLPAFVNVNPPPNAPPNTTSLAVVNVVFPVSVPTPPNVSVPLFVTSPIVTVPPSVSPFVANVRALVPSLETVPPLITNVPPPNAPLFPKYNAPAVTVTPPLNVFAPLNVNAPAPDFVTPNPPPNAPLNTNAFGLAGTVNVVAPPNVPAPLSVNAPVFVASPNVNDPANV
jgi:hypothetical protein